MKCEGCLEELSVFDKCQGYSVCFECTKTRHKAVLKTKCVCAGKKRESSIHKIGSRTWISCLRCLGQIKQLS